VQYVIKNTIVQCDVSIAVTASKTVGSRYAMSKAVKPIVKFDEYLGHLLLCPKCGLSLGSIDEVREGCIIKHQFTVIKKVFCDRCKTKIDWEDKK